MQVSPPASSSSNGPPVRPSLITPIDGPPTSKRSYTRERSQGAVEMSVRQIEEARQASLGRVLDVWSRLEERYAVPLEDDDVVDISTGRIVEDRGVLRSMLANGPRLFGFAPANEDEAEPVTEAETDCEVEEEESDDELGRWPSDKANHMDSLRRRMQLDPLDKEDLESFLRAERERRRLEDEEEQASSRATSPDLDAPLPEVYESDDGAQQLPPATSDIEGDLIEDSESEDELLLVDDDEAPSVTLVPTPVETQKEKPPPRSKLPLPTPPRSQSMDSRRALSVSPIKLPSTPARPARLPSRVASTPSSRSNVGASTSKPVFARPAPPAPKRVMEVVLPLYNKPSSASSSSPQPMVSYVCRKHAGQVLPSPSPSSVSDVPHVDFSRRRKSATPSLRKTQAAATSSPSSAIRKATPAARPVRQSASVPATPSSSSKGKGRVHRLVVPRSPSPTSEGEDPMALTSRTPSPGVDTEATPESPPPPPPPPHPSSSSSPRKRKRVSDADAQAQLASPSKRRAQSRTRERPKVENSPPSSPTQTVAGPSSAPAMAWPGWPVQMPMAPPAFAIPGMPMHPQPAGGQQAFVAQFMAQVQHMNMLAQAMLPSFFPAALVPHPHPPPPPPPPPAAPPRARSVDSRSPEPEQRPRSRSALRKSTSSAERSGVRKRVSFLLQNDRQSDDEDTRGRVRYRGTPAPGRGDARSRTSSAPAR